MIKKKQKVYVIVHFTDHEDGARIHSVYADEEKAQVRAGHLQRQYAKVSIQYGFKPNDTFAVLKKSVQGKVK